MNISRTRFAGAATAVAALTLLSACGTSSANPKPTMSMSNSSTPTMSATMPASSGMPGMVMHGNGTSATQDGYTLTLKSSPMAGMTMPVTLVITHNGRPVTAFDTEQTKKLHLYLIRTDLTGFEHLHPTMSTDGTWTAATTALAGGSYRVYTQIVPHADAANGPIVLSVPIDVGGTTTTAPLSAPSTATTVDGYTLAFNGPLHSGQTTTLRITKGGTGVTDLQPYLDTYAHVSAFREGDLAFTHLHPANAVTSAGGGPALQFRVEAPEPGTYRMFIQFKTAGTLHTAALTVSIA